MRRLILIATAGLVLALLGACGSSAPSGDEGPDTPVSDTDPVTARPVGDLTVTVVDAAGEPVSGAQVVPSSLDDPDRRFGQINRATDEGGEFTMRLRPGAYSITVSSGAVTSEPQEVVVTEGEATECVFELEL